MFRSKINFLDTSNSKTLSEIKKDNSSLSFFYFFVPDSSSHKSIIHECFENEEIADLINNTFTAYAIDTSSELGKEYWRFFNPLRKLYNDSFSNSIHIHRFYDGASSNHFGTLDTKALKKYIEETLSTFQNSLPSDVKEILKKNNHLSGKKVISRIPKPPSNFRNK